MADDPNPKVLEFLNSQNSLCFADDGLISQNFEKIVSPDSSINMPMLMVDHLRHKNYSNNYFKKITTAKFFYSYKIFFLDREVVYVANYVRYTLQDSNTVYSV